MTNESERELQQRLQNLEAEINSASVPDYQVHKIPNTDPANFTSTDVHIRRIVQWFKGLSKTAQVVVCGVGFLASLTMLQALFKLVSAVISLAILAVLLYLGYKFIVSKSLKGK
ncbi:hypothetical protein [Calothrix rhizosoleniae]|uniref:hypothetical protein n=1 Tax=Calothrix rhizosoleniae TaxID=888997 RepID=UPI000B49A8EC|nr:hypothetical protein [Calothrix rhizosoleniae]